MRMVGRRRRDHPTRELPPRRREVRTDRGDRSVGDHASCASGGKRAARTREPVRGFDRQPRPALTGSSRELSDAGADPANVVFEITETALMGDIERGRRRSLAASQTSAAPWRSTTSAPATEASPTYKSSTSHTSRSTSTFVRDLVSNTTNQHLVKAIVNIAHGLGQQTIAEGVENSETLDLLREYGVDLAQGFHIGRPAPIEES